MKPGKLIGLPRFMLDHRWTRAHIQDELDGQLAPNDRKRFRHHVAECRRCRRMLDSLRKTVDALKGLSGRPDPQVADRVIDRLDQVGAGTERPGDGPEPDP